MAVEKQTDDAMAQRLAQLEAQLALLASNSPGSKALELLAERSAPKENPNYNEISPFTHPEGEAVRPKPQLKRATFFCGATEREDRLTPKEIELYNRFTSGIRTSRNGQWTAEVIQNGSREELRVMVPHKGVDDRMNLPSLAMILLELLNGQEAADPTRLADRVAELEAKLAAATA